MRVYDSRVEMLSEVPKGGVCCEVGVFMLDFSRAILDVVAPSRLFLIDTFPAAMFSCDENGGNPRHIHGHMAIQAVAELCEKHESVSAIFGTSAESIPLIDAPLDFAYVDADHSYEGCTADMTALWAKVRPGGILAGHDYSLNPEKVVDAGHYAGFGVKRAVDEFCEARGVEIAAMAMDGYTSFLIRKPA